MVDDIVCGLFGGKPQTAPYVLSYRSRSSTTVCTPSQVVGRPKGG